MSEQTLPEAINNFVNYTNTADSENFVKTFTTDAILNDWGTEYKGHEGIASWNQTDNIGKKSQFEVVNAKKESDNTWIVNLKVTGNGFNGVSPFKMIVKDNLLQSVQILPD
ncbi:nuclear transport factor 2 family protein [Companilactobacillus zhachilii]|uniref:nuclear transport factor 2 family protein n=1 Tax=Companilactobacillus zhachilii TaxID=2304606 RepID=UPI001922097B|nr:nuclear transport factor 2 family protein [Companilactobacillus zhachilii]MBL3531488.1 nuclear transport factor 2 family protein [Companilactobacillus zhachilii]